ncbi:MAG: CehA/McbA family metallohydrolase, partial [Myxococcota bacterium]
LMNFSREQVAPNHEVQAVQGVRDAAIITRGRQAGVDFETRYSLSLDLPRDLRITTTLTRSAEGDSVFVFGDIALHGERQLSPFSISTRAPDQSIGYAHPAVDPDDPLTMVAAITGSDLHVMVGEDALEPGRAYGLLLRSALLVGPEGNAEALPHLSINSEHFSLLGVFARPFWIGAGSPPGWLELPQILFMDIGAGERVVYERSLLVGERADVASVTDQVWTDAPEVRGILSDPTGRLSFYRESGAPVTTRRPDPDGRFALRLPAGRYRAEVWAPGGREATRTFEVTPQGADLGRVELEPPARVRLPQGNPMRLVFVGIDGTPNPVFGADGRRFRVGDQEFFSAFRSNDRSLAGVPGDPQEVVLPPGRYRVIATRGPEFHVTESLIEARGGKTVRLEIAPPTRAVEFEGWLGADLHVHSALSDDSGLALRERLAAFQAQGADVVVSTEHDQVTDYGPVLERMGIGDELESIVGVEITTTVRDDTTPHTAGHHNAFPMRWQPDHYRGGAPAAEGKRLRSILATARNQNPGAMVQLNHPRPESGTSEGPRDGSLFTHQSVAGHAFDPTQPIDAETNAPLAEVDPETGLRDLDFDAMELLNGPKLSYYRAVRADWFSLLLQGEIRTGTANSDSHRLGTLVALPRTYVQMLTGPGTPFDEAVFMDALRAGRAFGTTGPLLEIRLGDRGIGERLEGTRAVLAVEVTAAPWIPVSAIRVYVNGALREERPVDGPGRFEFPLRFEQDAFVTVEVEGEPKGVYREVAPGFTPFAFSNPIFVDANGDGKWSPPGLAEPLPRTLTTPLAP